MDRQTLRRLERGHADIMMRVRRAIGKHIDIEEHDFQAFLNMNG